VIVDLWRIYFAALFLKYIEMLSVLPAPYRNEGLNKVYNLLFCDQPDLFKTEQKQPSGYPWDILLATVTSVDDLQKIIDDGSAETRARILAYQRLTDNGYTAGKKELLGVIIEVGLEKGLDVLAAYKDGSARYINQSGKIIIWEPGSATAELLIDTLFEKSKHVVSNIGVWEKDRLPAPGADNVRLSFLVSDGLYFGQGPFDVLEADAMGGPVIHAATQLMIFLTEQKG
jgi:hypothetical protein